MCVCVCFFARFSLVVCGCVCSCVVCLHLSEVPLLVQRQMVGPGETSLAVATLEWFGASVLAVMAGQLVRPGKAPAAADPLAFVRLFAGMRPEVGFQVRTLRVHLLTARILALVYLLGGVR